MFKINDRNIDFDINVYNESSLNAPRSILQQFSTSNFIQLLEVFKESFKIKKIQLPVKSLKPSHSQVKYSDILLEAAKNPVIESGQLIFVASQSLNILDGHNRHVKAYLIDESQMCTCYIIDETTERSINLLKFFKKFLTSNKELSSSQLNEAVLLINSSELENFLSISMLSVYESTKKIAKTINEAEITKKKKVPVSQRKKEWLFTINRDNEGLIQTVNAIEK